MVSSVNEIYNSILYKKERKIGMEGSLIIEGEIGNGYVWVYLLESRNVLYNYCRVLFIDDTGYWEINDGVIMLYSMNTRIVEKRVEGFRIYDGYVDFSEKKYMGFVLDTETNIRRYFELDFL